MATIGIVGAGPGGLRLSAHLGLAGHRIRLNDINDAPLALVKNRGGLDVEHLDGTPRGFAPVERATLDLAETVKGADIVIVVSGGNTQPKVARALAKLLEDGQLVLLIQGNTGGSLIVRRELDAAGCRAKIVLCEMDCYPHAMRRPEPTRFRRTTDKRWLQVAAFPASDTSEAIDRLKPLFPQIVAAPDILHTGLTNMNAVLHCANCISNAARIEAGGGYPFYGEGVTPAVARLYEAVDQDRLAVARALGTGILSLPDWFERVYGVRENTPAIDAVIAIAQFQLGRSFEREARTLERMGLAGLDGAGIVKTAREGFR